MLQRRPFFVSNPMAVGFAIRITLGTMVVKTLGEYINYVKTEKSKISGI